MYIVRQAINYASIAIDKGIFFFNEKKFQGFFFQQKKIVCLFVLFGLYVAFNNLLVISRQCLDVAGSLMLTFRVLPH